MAVRESSHHMASSSKLGCGSCPSAVECVGGAESSLHPTHISAPRFPYLLSKTRTRRPQVLVIQQDDKIRSDMGDQADLSVGPFPLPTSSCLQHTLTCTSTCMQHTCTFLSISCPNTYVLTKIHAFLISTLNLMFTFSSSKLSCWEPSQFDSWTDSCQISHLYLAALSKKLPPTWPCFR